jgi:hypothetical protein
MLAIAGGVSWLGYLVMVYGLSQLAGQNYSFLDLAIPGKFTLGTPAPDAPSTGGGSTTPCSAAQLAAGYTNDSSGNCQQGVKKNPKTGTNVGPGAGSGAQGTYQGPWSSQAECQKKGSGVCVQSNGKWYAFSSNGH